MAIPVLGDAMLRLLVAYLVLATAAGPALCCCSLPQLAARLAGGQPAPEELPPCCRPAATPDDRSCYRPPADDERPLQGGCPGDGGRREGGCPCRENGSRPALLDRPADQSEQPLASQWLAPAPAPLFDGPAASASGPSPWDKPPPAARDILRLLSRLRC